MLAYHLYGQIATMHTAEISGMAFHKFRARRVSAQRVSALTPVWTILCNEQMHQVTYQMNALTPYITLHWSCDPR
jgi:hypothetical protein